MLGLYNTALLPLRLVAAVWAMRPGRTAASRREWAERCGWRTPAIRSGGAWIHGSSMGEAQIAATIAREIRSRRPDLPLAVSAYTPTGRDQLPDPPLVDASFFVPLDFSTACRRVLSALRPASLVIVETELWPNLLHAAGAVGVPVVLLNGRLSRRRMNRYRKLSALFRPALERMAGVGAQSTEDADRFAELGAPRERLVVTGNVKYDLPLPEPGAQELRRRLGLEDRRPIFVAGSTAAGEEEPVLDAFAAARRLLDDLLLILAPRRLSRLDEVESLVRSRRLGVTRLSALETEPAGADVLLVDTMGELFSLYQLATVAFVGGSLVPIGGHNLLEPAAVGAPVLFGPHTENTREPARALERAGGGTRVRDGNELRQQLVRLLEDGARREEMARRAAEVVRANRGAMTISLDLLFDCLDQAGPTGTGSA